MSTETEVVIQDKAKVKLTPYQLIFYYEWLQNPLRSDYSIVIDNNVEGDIDFNKVNQSFLAVANEHFILSHSICDQDDEIYWKPRKPAKSIAIYHPTPLSDQEIYNIISAPFDLENDLYMRVHLIRLSDKKYRMIFILHHIVVDGVSTAEIWDKFRKNYNGITYDNFSMNQQRALHEEVNQYFKGLLVEHKETIVDFWKKHLQGIEGIDLSFLKKKDTTPSTLRRIVDEYMFSFDEETYNQVKKLRYQYKITPYILGQMVLAIVFHKLTNKNELALAYPIAFTEAKELMYGSHINTMLIDYRFDQETTLKSLMDYATSYFKEQKQTKAKYLPINEIVQYADAANVLDVAFAQTFFRDHQSGLNGVIDGEVNHDFHIDLVSTLLFEQQEHNSKINYRIRFDRDVLDAKAIEQLVSIYQYLFRQIVALLSNNQADTAIKDLSLLDEQTRDLLVYQYNTTYCTDFLNDTIIEHFESLVEKIPDQTAVVYKDQRLSYQELNKRANLLAAYLKDKLSLEANDIVALCLDRSELMLISMLAVLKAGAAYVPISPSAPDERIAFIVTDANAKGIVINEAYQERFTQLLSKTPAVILEQHTPESLAENYSTHNLLVNVFPKHLAYVIYTSGTTGTPKGVMIEHKGLMNLSVMQGKSFGLVDKGLGQHCLWYSDYVFDAHVSEIYTAIVNGHTLFILEEDKRLDFQALQQYIATNHIAIATIPPVLLDKDSLLALQTLVVAGDVTHPSIMDSYRKQGTCVINAYGPSEGSVCSSLHYYEIGDGYTNIGRPLGNVTCYILNQYLEPVPAGVTGMLYIGGIGIARGYLNNITLTDQTFMANPFQREEEKISHYNDRLYKTGDLARYTKDGSIEYMGRNDFQVKIRGFRIELEEIESRLLTFPEVDKVTVLVKENPTTKAKYLAAYYVAKQALNNNELIAHLAQTLPDYMVPNVFVFMDAFPVLLSGKIDRKALPEPQLSTNTHYVAPTNEMEHKLCALFAQVLGLELSQVGIEDDFFRLGGDSITGIQLVSRIRQQLGVNIGVNDIFSCRTIKSLCHHFYLNQSTIFKSIETEQGILDGLVPLLPIQAWFFNKWKRGTFKNVNHWNQCFVLQVPPLCKATLQEAVAKLIDYHDAFRLSYTIKTEGYQAEQFYNKSLESLPLEFVSESSLTPSLLDEKIAALNTSFDINEPPLLRVLGLTDQNNRCVKLYFIVHHLIIDAVSWRIIKSDLQKIYGGLIEDKTANVEQLLGNKTSSYRQWSNAIKNYQADNLEGMVFEKNYWTDVAQRAGVINKGIESIALEETIEQKIVFDKAFTKRLTQTIPEVFNTQINDLLLCALALSIHQLTGQVELAVTVEGHGRQADIETLDITNTVGWFTCIYPVVLSVVADDPLLTLVNTKDYLRRIPNNGIGYGALKGYSESPLPSISFNYLGQFDSTDDEQSWCFINDQHAGLNSSPENKDDSLLALNGGIIDEALQFLVAARLSVEQLQRFTSAFEQQLKNIVNSLAQKKRNYLTLSDIDYRISASLLNTLQASREVESIYLANSLQQGFIYHAISQGDEDEAYRSQLLWDYHVAIDIDKLKQAWQLAQQKYPSLRLRFSWDETLIQIVDKKGEVDWRFIDVTNATEAEKQHTFERVLAQDTKEPYDLTASNLFRVYVIKYSDNFYRCIFNNHHAILDGWSNPILLSFVHNSYLALLDNQKVTINEDTCYLKAQAHVQQHKQTQQKYWQEYLQVAQDKEQENLSALFKAEHKQVLLSEHKEVKEPQSTTVIIESNRYVTMKDFCMAHGVTVNALLQYLWHKLLSLYSRSDITVVGMTVAGRSLPLAGIEESVGLYINTLPIVLSHTDVEVITLIKQLQEAINEGNHRSNIDLVTLQKAGERLFNTLFVYENYPMPEDIKKGDQLAIKFNKAIEKQDYPLVVTVHEVDQQVSIKIQYAGELFESKAIELLMARFPLLLSQLLACPAIKANAFSYLQPNEYQQFVERNTYPQSSTPAQTINAVFAKQVAEHSDRVAVKSKNQQLTYRELEDKSNRLAEYLQTQYALKPNDLVALCLERSTYQLVAILAVLKAGAAYVPMDPKAATERLSFMVEDTQSKVVLVDRVNQVHLQQILPAHVDVKAIDDQAFEQMLADSFAERKPADNVTPSDLAYIIYTSGTTGQPKGVMVEHRNVINLFTCTDELYHFNHQDVWTLFHSYTFDFSVWEIWGALLFGGKLLVPDADTVKDTDVFYDLCIKESVTVLNQTPSAFYQFIEVAKDKASRLNALRYVIFGGEALNFTQLKPWYQLYKDDQPCLINMYGITETTVHVTYKKLVADDLGAASLIGSALPSYTSYLLNPALRPVPAGVVGELYIGGYGVTRGYLNNTALTEQRFINNPFQTAEQKQQHYNDRLYKTGDLARLMPDGALEYIGRADFQVKIRGFRIELGEIEAKLSSFDGIKKSAVLVLDQGANKLLVAYYVADKVISEEAIVAYLKQYLPDYMIPMAFIAMDSFPLTVNGKLDRHKMPNPVMTQSTQYVAATNELELKLCQLFADVLGIDSDSVGIEDDFFRLGGDSISCIQLISRIRQQLNAKVSVKEVFASRTVKALAQKVSSQGHVNIITEQGALLGNVALLPIQEWFFDQTKKGLYNAPNHWNQSVVVNVPTLNSELLKLTVAKLVSYHDALRMVFTANQRAEFGYEQSYQENIAAIGFTAVSVKDYASPEQQAKLFTQWQAHFNIEKGQLYHIGYLADYEDGRARLHITLHHLIVDAVSLRIIKDHLQLIYQYLVEHPEEAETVTAEHILGAKGTSYRQWGEALARYAQAQQSQVDYWQNIMAEGEAVNRHLIEKATASTSLVQLRLTEQQTRHIMRDVHDVYQTQINDLLLTALTLSLESCFHLGKYAVLLEGHGREEIDEQVDINRTVGWFTSFYPVLLSADITDVKQLLVSVKDQLRTIPDHGVGYGAIEGYCHRTLPKIAFNYLGNFTTEAQEQSWYFTREDAGVSVSTQNTDDLVLNINGLVIDNTLSFSIAGKLSVDQLDLLAESYKEHLQQLINALLAEKHHYLTLSDIDSIISKPLLDKLQENQELEAVYKANSLQQGFVYHALSQGDKDEAYRTQMVWEYHRELNTPLLQKAWLLAQQHYPVLRLRFSWDEEIVQVIDKQSQLSWRFIDLTDQTVAAQQNEVNEILLADRAQGYDLGVSGLFRITLIKQKANHFVCVFNNHHAILDGWSNPLLITFVHDLYLQLLNGHTPELSVDKSYLKAQAYLQEHDQQDKPFWDDYLGQLEEAEDLSALLKPALKSIKLSDYKHIKEPKEQELAIKHLDYQALKQLCHSHGITLNAVMQYCWHKLLSVYGNTQTSVLGMTVSGRNIPVDDIEQSVGLFINTLPVVLTHSEKMVTDKLVELQNLINEVNNRSHVELVKLQKNGQRLFNSLFIFENYPAPDEGQDNPLGLNFKAIQEKMDYPLAITAYEADASLIMKLRYAGDLFSENTIAKLLTGINGLLKQLLANPFITENNFQYLTNADYNKVIVDWNKTQKDYPKDKTMSSLFVDQAAITPDAIAIKHKDTTLSYRQLDEQTNLLANHLKKKYQIKPDDIVAICLDRSPFMLTSILAILKAGGAYVPIDVHAPDDRFAYILEQTNAKAVITDHANQHRFDSLLSSALQLELIDDESYWQWLAKNYTNTKPSTETKSNNLAYVLFTSGTTGNPKGVMIEQRAYINLVYHYKNTYFNELPKVDTFSITNYVFDIWGLEYGLPLFSGGFIELATSDFEKINTADYSFIQMTPSVWSACLDKITFNNPQLYVLAGGEPVTHQLLDKFFTGHELAGVLNVYGPTETTIWSTTELNTATHYSNSIGRPISNTSIYVLNTSLQPVPVGVLGELYIGGDGVARGYLNNPDLTHKSFINNPYQTQQEKDSGYNDRLYKTGDLVRYLEDGCLDFVGRNDFQVKIRGFRIELGEIESRISAYPTIKQAIVVAKEHSSGNKYLVAYYLANEPVVEEELKAHLSQYLTDYMIPSVFIGLTEFPLTPSGKVNRKALPDATFGDDEARYVAPETPLEVSLCGLFAKVLAQPVSTIGIEDNFFELGGDSILVIKLVNLINKSVVGSLQLVDVFNCPTVKMLAQKLQSDESVEQGITIDQSINEQEKILSFAQERLWFIEKYEKGSNAYNIPMVFKLKDQVNISRLQLALQTVMNRHEVLRSLIKENDLGEGYQEVLDYPLVIDSVTLESRKELDNALETAINHIFNLAVEYPIKATVYRLQNSHYMTVVVHHIAFDGWSTDIFINEVINHYYYFESAAVGAYETAQKYIMPALNLQYKDYARWQKNHLSGDFLNQQKAYWVNKLTDFETLNLPTDNVRPPKVNYQGEDFVFELDAELSEALHKIAKKLGVTLYSVLLSAYYLMLGVFSNQKDIVVGAPIANRNYSDIANLIGFFVNTLALRQQIDKTQTLQQFIKQVGAAIAEAQAYQELPFERLVEELKLDKDPSRHPIFQVTFGMESFGKDQMEEVSRLFEPYHQIMPKVAKFDLSLVLKDIDGQLSGTFNYATALFNKPTIDSFAQTYKVLLSQFADSALLKAPIKELNYVTEAQFNQIIHQWNKTDYPYPANQTLHSLFEEHAAAIPECIALVCNGRSLSYHELNTRANQLAHYLKEQCQLDPEAMIGLYLDRSELMIIAMLAVMKAGAAYVPIAPDAPTERVSHIINDTQMTVILTNQAYINTLSQLVDTDSVVLLGIDREEVIKALGSMPDKNLPAVGVHQLAYVIYTSGTTGLPKGVMIEHTTVLNFIWSVSCRMGLLFDKGNQKNILWISNYVFDAHVFDIYSTLLQGHRLYILTGEERTDLLKIKQAVKDNNIDMGYIPPVLLDKENIIPLKTLIVAGEVANAEVVESYLQKGITVFNMYGPTEISVGSNTHCFKLGDKNTNIGKAVANDRLYLADEYMKLLPIGALGELYIGGVGVGRGYLNNPELTKERFLSNPFRTEEDKQKDINHRVYKSGDVVKYLANGDIEYIGRNDFQVKIRGLRIELAEIENKLSGYDIIQKVAVLTRKYPSGEAYIAAYYVAGHEIDKDHLNEYLAQYLPDYMLPSSYVYMDDFPYTLNGKLDQRKLPDPMLNYQKNLVEPINDTEVQLRGLFAEVLKLEAYNVSVEDSFFELGGNSILVIKLANLVKKSFGSELPIAVIFTHKTIRKLAHYLLTTGISESITINPVVIEKPEQQLLSFAQQRLWFIESFQGGSSAYNIPILLALELSTDKAIFIQALRTIIHRHQVLRTVIKKNDEANAYQQVIDDEVSPLEINSVNVASEDELKQRLLADINYLFKLDREYPIKVTLYQVADKYYMSIVVHHIAFDGWSADILIREMDQFYHYYLLLQQGKTEEVLSYLPQELPIQYKDYALWQRAYLASDKARDQLDFWRNKLVDYRMLALPLDKPRPARADFSGDNVSFSLSVDVSRDLRTVAKNLDISLNSLLLSAYYLLLMAYSNQDDIVLGIPVANRNIHEVESLIGFFVNSLALRQQVDREVSLVDFIHNVAESITQAQLNQDLPFDLLVSELKIEQDLSRNPIFQVMFSLQSFGEMKESGVNDLVTLYNIEDYLEQTVAKFDLTTMIDDSAESITGIFNFATSLFERRTIVSYVDTYVLILEQLTCLCHKDSHDLTIGDLTYVSNHSVSDDGEAIDDDWSQYEV